jgi:trehalose/maltose transport system permease protein
MSALIRIVRRLAFWLLIAGIVFYAVFPFYWAVVSSFETGSALFEVGPPPRSPSRSP